MVLVDTSIWIDHLRAGDAALAGLLESGQVLIHAFIIGEIALGKLHQRDLILQSLDELPRVAGVANDELLYFIFVHDLAGSGIGLIDAHLLASISSIKEAQLWTRDRRLRRVAHGLGVAWESPIRS